MRAPPSSDPASGFWQPLAANLDAAPFSPSGKFSIPLVNVAAILPLNPDGRVDGRGVNQDVGEAPGRWSNCRVFLDVPQSFAVLDDVLFTLWADTQGVSTIVAEAAVSAMALEAYQVASPVPRLRGVALGGSGMPGIRWRVTCRSKTDFFAFAEDPAIGNPVWPLGTVALEVWGTESPLGLVQGAPGASLGHGGYKDNPVTTYAAEGLGWNAANGVWLPLSVNAAGNLTTAAPVAASRSVFVGSVDGTAQVGPTTLRALHAVNGTATDLFLQLFDFPALPNPGDAPTYCYAASKAGGGGDPNVDLVAAWPHAFTDGLHFAWSDVSYKYSPPGVVQDLVTTLLFE